VVAATTIHGQNGLPQRDAFLLVRQATAGGIGPPEIASLRPTFEDGAPTVRLLLFIVLAIASVGAILAAAIRLLLLGPLMSASKRRDEGWAMGTWFAFDTSEALNKISTGIPGIVWLTDKRNFALLMHLRQDGVALPTPPSFLVQGGGKLCLPGVSVDGGCSPWFMKNANIDCCDDNNCFDTLDGCVQQNAASCRVARHKVQERLNQAYVAQPHVARPMLIEGHKFDMRVHVVMVARKAPLAIGTEVSADPASLLQAFLFEEVIVKLARDPWNPDKLESASQHTNMHGAAQGSSFHQRLLRNMPQGDEILRSVKHSIELCLETARGVLHQGAEVDARHILGIDVMVDEDLRAWVLEFNYYPGDDPDCMAPGVYEVAYLPLKRDIPELTSQPILEGRPAQALKGWQELRF